MEIRKIVCACGSGLGSSLMVQMNIEDVLAELGRSDVQVSHTTISDIQADAADLFVVGRDLEHFVRGIPGERLVVLANIVDKAELLSKLKERLEHA